MNLLTAPRPLSVLTVALVSSSRHRAFADPAEFSRCLADEQRDHRTEIAIRPVSKQRYDDEPELFAKPVAPYRISFTEDEPAP
jgi:hypothetical protein